MNFLDPLTTTDGRPYGPVRFRELIKEKYIIAENSNNITYSDIDNMTPSEREEVLGFVVEKLRKTQELIEARKQQRK